jgi:outer membrane protein assembly factor BamB
VTFRHWALGLLAAAVCAPYSAASAAVPAWTTYRHDGARTGLDPDSGSPVAPAQAWQTTPALDGDIYGQPLVYGSRVYVATENDSVYALDAATGAVVWHKSAGVAVPAGNIPCGIIDPTVGITSTPVIDPLTGKIYVVADTWDGQSIQHRLASFNLSDGTPGISIAVDPPGSIPANQLQRPGLALDAGRIVIGFGGNAGDCGDYHGYVVSVPEAGGALSSFQVSPPPGAHGAIWGSGTAPAIDASGDLLVATGNGDAANFGFQESVVKLDPAMNRLDSWTPANWLLLDASDRDLGSSEPVLLPGGRAFQIGKEGVGYLLSESPLAPRAQASICAPGGFGGGVYSAGVIYPSCTDGLRAVSSDTLAALPGWTVNPQAVGPPILAGGLIWSAGWNNGTLYGLDPATGATRFSESLGSFDHFSSPGAGGGRLFVANGNRVTAYTIANPPPPSATTTTLRSSLSRRTLTLTATVSPGPDAGALSFRDRSGLIPGCSPAPLSAAVNQAACTASLARVGTHSIVATYSGDPYYRPSRSRVVRAPSTLKLSALTLRVSGRTLALTLTLSARAVVTVVIRQRKPGRCVRRERRCVVLVRRAKRTFAVRAGRHRIKLRLTPGRYIATVSARDSAGQQTTRHTVSFRIRR